MSKKRKIALIAAIACTVVIVPFALSWLIVSIETYQEHASIDCERIYKADKEARAQGAAIDLTYEAIQKCYTNR